MILDSISIKNYRSIFEIKNLKFSDTLTTFIGKNNQGKSNILKAIDLVFQCINMQSEMALGRRPYLFRDIDYRWENDFPVQKQNRGKYDQTTKISIALLLSEQEIEDYSKNIGFRIAPKLFASITFEKEHKYKFELSSSGISKQKFQNSDILIKSALWILGKINFQYIPAIRTENLADKIANNIISLELSQLAPKKREKLEEAIKQIDELQKPILRQLEKNLSSTLKEFVPDIQKVSLNEKRSSYHYSRRYSDDTDFYIKIDDGSDTMLSQKGDGVKSLITLGMMRQKGNSGIGKGLILAIEEPESHLHPEAIRQIGIVVHDIAQNNQVIVTSHSPLFVNRDKISDNIIVADNSASYAHNIKQIRDTLGCIASDNLINADFIIVVEGETDKIILQKYLCVHSALIKDWIENKRLGFEVINGVYNLEHSLNKLLNMSSKYFCILDSDKIAKNYVKSAKNKSFLSSGEKEVCYYTLTGLNECELEDLIKPEYYTDYVEEKIGINIKECKEFCKSNKKWSERIKEALKAKGKSYDEEEFKTILDTIKKYICNIDAEIDEMLISNRTSSIVSFPEQIEKYFKIKGV